MRADGCVCKSRERFFWNSFYAIGLLQEEKQTNGDI